MQKCSGGERQRVALARALAYDPEILFFDEPLSAIDYKLRKTLEKELKDIHRETGKTFVYITHSLEEAMVMSDRIGVMRAGKLVQVGTPKEIYSRAAKTSSSPSSWATSTSSRCRAPATAACSRRRSRRTFTAAAMARRHRVGPSGHPAGVHALPRQGRRGRQHASSGRLYNEYALGSRIQYQVRVGDQVFVVEKLRQQAYQRQASTIRCSSAGTPQRLAFWWGEE